MMEKRREEQWRERVATRLTYLLLVQRLEPSLSGHLTLGIDLLLEVVRAAYQQGYVEGQQDTS